MPSRVNSLRAENCSARRLSQENLVFRDLPLTLESATPRGRADANQFFP